MFPSVFVVHLCVQEISTHASCITSSGLFLVKSSATSCVFQDEVSKLYVQHCTEQSKAKLEVCVLFMENVCGCVRTCVCVCACACVRV